MYPALLLAVCLGLEPLAAPAAADGLDSGRAGAVMIEHLVPGARIFAVAGDQRRFLWFGTDYGLVRYDGYAMQPFHRLNMPTKQVWAISPAKDGQLWIGTHGAAPLRHLDARAWSIAEVPLAPDVTDVFAIAQRKDEIWAGTNRGLYRVTNDRSQPVPLTPVPTVEVRGLLVSRDQSVWVAHAAGVARVDATGRVAVMNEAPNAVTLAQGNDGRVWVGYSAPSDYQTRVLSEAGAELSLIPGGTIAATLADPDGTLWFATIRGLARSSGTSTITNTPLNTDFDRRLQALARDAEGGLWVGSASSGVFHIDTAPSLTLLPRVGRDGDSFQFSIAEDARRRVWISTTMSVVRHDAGRADVLEYGPGTGLPYDVRALSPASDGGVWAASAADGAVHLSEDVHGKLLVKAVHRRGTRAIFDDHKGTVWFAWSNGGLGRSDRGAKPSDVLLEGNPSITFIAPAREGGLWLGSDEHGAVRLFADGHTESFDERHGLPSNRVFSMAELPNGVLCVGTSAGGLDCGRSGHFVHYGADEGLVDAVVGAIVVDPYGTVWLGTTNGIVRLNAPPDPSRRFVPARRLGLSAGMKSVECAHSFGASGTLLSDGSLVFATTRDAVRIDPRRLGAQKAPPVVVDELILNGQTMPLPSPDESWPLGEGNVEIRYAAPRFTGADALNFRHRLEGQDQGWINAGQRRVAIYTNLAPGPYAFTVMVEDGDSSATATTAFVLRPPFHRTWTFLLTMMAAAATVVAGLFRMRARNLRMRRAAVLAERSRLARELHDTIEQSVVAVRLQLDAAIMDSGGDAAGSRSALAHVERAVELLVDTSSEMRTAIHALRASDGRPRDLVVEISNAAGRLLRGSDVRFHLELAAPEPPRLPLHQQQQVLAVITEAMTNAVKHGDAANVTVSIAAPAGAVEITVRDDGRGFDAGVPVEGGHYGLLGMRERAESIGASIHIDANVGTGTTVTLRLPTSKPQKRIA